MLNPSVSVVGFKNFCASIPLKGDLKTQINFPTGLPWKSVAEDPQPFLFRALTDFEIQTLRPLLRGLCSKMDKDFSIEESIFQLPYSRYDSFTKSKSQAGT
jgi:hypothetical protein